MRWNTKHVSENYFDLEGRTSDELKRRYYVAGAFLLGYTPVMGGGVEFRSRHLELVETVRRELNIEHKIRSNNNHSYFVRIEKAPYLRSALEDMGLAEDKYQREFPDVQPQYLQPLVRGLIDQRAVFYESRSGTSRISIAAGHLLLKWLNIALVNHAGIKRDPPIRNVIEYAIADSVKIYSFIYSDWDFIRKYWLYVQAVKQMLETNVNHNAPLHHSTREAAARIEKAKRILAIGGTIEQAANEAGYAYATALNPTFKKKVGMTPAEFARKRKFLSAPVKINVFGGSLPLGRRSYTSG